MRWIIVLLRHFSFIGKLYMDYEVLEIFLTAQKDVIQATQQIEKDG